VQGKSLPGAIKAALSKARRQGPPEVGGKLSVTLTEREAPSNPILSPTNIFTATYQSPASTATSEFFNLPKDAPAAAGPVKPESIDQKAWDAMDAATRTAIAATLSQLTPQSDEPPF
jgi:hypothetical protein